MPRGLFDPPEALAGLRGQCPVAPFRLPDGQRAWLVTSHADARAVLRDPDFSVQDRLEVRALPAIPGAFAAMDPPEHTRYRKPIAAHFSTSRIRALRPRIEDIVSARLRTLRAAGPGADLVAEFAIPVPAQVMCELAGVPYERRADFQQSISALQKMGTDPQAAVIASFELIDFLTPLVEAKRADPGDDIISALIHGGGAPEPFDDGEVVMMAMMLVAAGFETTASMIGLGTLALLEHPDQAALLRKDPALMATAVDELLRYLTIMHWGVSRVARAQVPLGGHTVQPGDMVVVALNAANRDAAAFTDPDQLDVTRRDNPHLTFSSGPHQCVGAAFARVELEIALRGLLTEFPGLALDVPVDAVPLRSGMGIFGVHALPVRWDDTPAEEGQ
jgi:cytochrome P450